MDHHDETTHAQRSEQIRKLNDQLRTTGLGGKLMLTRAVACVSAATLEQVVKAVRAFDTFTPANDPWGEHDFGKVEVEGATYFWKIDAYDINLEYGSSDPADETITRRVMTVMTAVDL